MRILELWRYPIKGFGGCKTKSATLAANGYFPYDRHFAISTGGEKIATARPGTWFPKAHFLQLMAHEALARYDCQYRTDGPEPMLELFHLGRCFLSINPNNDDGRRQFEDFIVENFGNHLLGQPRLMKRKDQAYSDQSVAFISIASYASITTFAYATGTIPDSRRFRINIITHNDKAFAEAEMIGQTFHCGDAVLMVQEPIGRCAAINVDPKTAQRSDQDYVHFMRKEFGHSNLGVFAKVIKGGKIKVGDGLRPT
jgi:uncharacterized protein YcbX